MHASPDASPVTFPELLSPALLAKLERLQMGTRRPLVGHFSGEHRSPRFGTSLDFTDYRDYHPGDDFRRIDYHLYGRLGVLLIKLFEGEEDLTVRLLVDTSGSMGVEGKLAQACRVAAALGFVALVRRDAVTLHTFPLDRPPLRFAGRSASSALFDQLRSLDAGGDTPFAAAATHLLSRPGPHGLTVLVSDLLTPDWEVGLSRLPSRHDDLTVVHVLGPSDLRPPIVGDADLVDRESGARVAVTISEDTAAQYGAIADEWSDRVARTCRRAGAGYVRVASTDDIEPLLLGAWRANGVLR